MKKMIGLILGAVLLVSLLSRCTTDYEEDITGPAGACDTTALSLAADIRPILESVCMNCHTTNLSFGGVALETYPELKSWVDNGILLSSVLHDGNASPMPKSQARLPDCQINKITAWIQQGALNN